MSGSNWTRAAFILLVTAALCWSEPARAIKAGLCNFTCNGSGPTLITGSGYENGAVSAPEFILIFWDDGTGTRPWSTNNPSKTQIIATAQSVMNGPFSAALSQYGLSGGAHGWVGRWRMAPYAYTYVGSTPVTHAVFSNFSKTQLNEIVNNHAIPNGFVPGGNPNQWTYYVIVVPSGVTATDCAFSCNDSIQYDPNGYPWDRIYVQGTTGFGGALTHELVEGVMNYHGSGFCGIGPNSQRCTQNSQCPSGTCDLPAGYCTWNNCTWENSCYSNSTPPPLGNGGGSMNVCGFYCTQGSQCTTGVCSANQCTCNTSADCPGGRACNGGQCACATGGGWGHADLCCTTEYQDSQSLEAYYSVADGACVIPESWQGFQVNLDRGAGWTQPSGAPSTLRQLYGGAQGVLATDSMDLAWFYNSNGGGWSQTGSAAGAQMAVGGTSASNVEIAWTDPSDAASGPYACGPTDGASSCANGNPTLSAPPDTVTGILVTNSGYVVATGKSGNVFIHSKSKNAWYTINGSYNFDQIVTTASGDIIGLDSSRKYVYDYSGTNLSNWYNNGVCSGCAWTQQNYSGQTNWYYPIMLVGNPDATLWGAVWASNANGTFLMYAPYGTTFIENQYFGGEYVATNAHTAFGTHSWFQWMTPSYNGGYTENDLLATTGAVINGKTVWSTTSGTGGRLIGGNNFYATTCTTATLPNCVNF